MKGDKVRLKHDSQYYFQCPDIEGTIVVSCLEDECDGGTDEYKHNGEWYYLVEGYYYIVEFCNGYENCYRDEDLEPDWVSKTSLGELL
jgi:hypothetical protein